VLEETFLDVPPPDITKSEQSTVVGLRKLVQPLDFSNTNVTEEELNSLLAAFDVVREAHSSATLKYRQGGQRTRLTQTLVESLLDTQALNDFRVPLCFRETDDDLEVSFNKNDNTLD